MSVRVQRVRFEDHERQMAANRAAMRDRQPIDGQNEMFNNDYTWRMKMQAQESFDTNYNMAVSVDGDEDYTWDNAPYHYRAAFGALVVSSIELKPRPTKRPVKEPRNSLRYHDMHERKEKVKPILKTPKADTQELDKSTKPPNRSSRTKPQVPGTPKLQQPLDRNTGNSENSRDRNVAFSTKACDRKLGNSATPRDRNAGNPASPGDRSAGNSAIPGDRSAGNTPIPRDRNAGNSAIPGDRSAGNSSLLLNRSAASLTVEPECSKDNYSEAAVFSDSGAEPVLSQEAPRTPQRSTTLSNNILGTPKSQVKPKSTESTPNAYVRAPPPSKESSPTSLNTRECYRLLFASETPTQALNSVLKKRLEEKSCCFVKTTSGSLHDLMKSDVELCMYKPRHKHSKRSGKTDKWQGQQRTPHGSFHTNVYRALKKGTEWNQNSASPKHHTRKCRIKKNKSSNAFSKLSKGTLTKSREAGSIFKFLDNINTFDLKHTETGKKSRSQSGRKRSHRKRKAPRRKVVHYECRKTKLPGDDVIKREMLRILCEKLRYIKLREAPAGETADGSFANPTRSSSEVVSRAGGKLSGSNTPINPTKARSALSMSRKRSLSITGKVVDKAEQSTSENGLSMVPSYHDVENLNCNWWEEYEKPDEPENPIPSSPNAASTSAAAQSTAVVSKSNANIKKVRTIPTDLPGTSGLVRHGNLRVTPIVKSLKIFPKVVPRTGRNPGTSHDAYLNTDRRCSCSHTLEREVTFMEPPVVVKKGEPTRKSIEQKCQEPPMISRSLTSDKYHPKYSSSVDKNPRKMANIDSHIATSFSDLNLRPSSSVDPYKRPLEGSLRQQLLREISRPQSDEALLDSDEDSYSAHLSRVQQFAYAKYAQTRSRAKFGSDVMEIVKYPPAGQSRPSTPTTKTQRTNPGAHTSRTAHPSPETPAVSSKGKGKHTRGLKFDYDYNGRRIKHS